MSQDYQEYQAAAERIAIEAGALLRDAYGKVVAREKGPGDLVTDADGMPRLIELELTEPSLFLDHAEHGAERFVEFLAADLPI